ncbi:MAG: leucine-rich repeat protein [Acutalibacteraceae bacterium]|nr:leucine-rich repeat protein [Acutalibacteraceae bacterium]
MNKKIVKPIALILVAALLMSFSLAYFTDRAETQANGTAGTVAISLANNINLLDANGQDIINPGDKRTAGLVVTNEGNKSIDVRTTVALTAVDYNGDPINFTGDADNQSEYDLYLASDVELVEGKGYAPKTGAKPLQVKSINGNVIKYVLPEYSLNGNSDKYPEVETIDGVAEFSHTHDLVMVMKGGADNAWQGSSMRIDVLVEAKQHENTAAGWTIVAQENVTHGSINQDAVLSENVLTDENGTANGTITFSLKKQDGSNTSGIPNVTMKLVKLPENTLSTVNTLGGTVLGTVRSDSNGEGKFMGLEEGKYALVSPNFVLTTEAENLQIVGVDGTDHYEYLGLIDWAATIEGTIVDSQGTGVPDVEVNIVDENKDFVAGSTTDENGDYTIYPVVEGTYELEVENNQITSGNSTVTVTEGNTAAAEDITVEPVAEPVVAVFSGYLTNPSCHDWDNMYDESNLELHGPTCWSSCNDSLTWSELKDPANGIKYGYLAEEINDNAIAPSNYGCFDNTRLKSIIVPEHVTYVGNMAFNECHYLTDVQLPSNLTKISEALCSGCVNLTNINIPTGVTEIGECAFQRNAFTSITIPAGVTEIKANTFSNCSKLTTVSMPDGITSIGQFAFGECKNLQNVTLPASLRTIGEGAFCGPNKITSVTIPANVEVLDTMAFADCANLQTVVFAGNNLTSIGNEAFRNNTALTTITIPEGVTTISEGAFSQCTSLDEIGIPSSVISIGDYALDATNAIKNINFAGTMAQFRNVSKGTFWNNTYGTIIHCSDGCLNVDGDIVQCPIHSGGIYYVGVTSTTKGSYTGATATYTNKADFPATPSTGDVYVCGDYEYRYNVRVNPADLSLIQDETMDGWNVMCLSYSAGSSPILETICGKPVVNMDYTFNNFSTMTTSPAIPSTVKSLQMTYTASGLTVAPEIPDGLENMNTAFAFCSSLQTGPSKIPGSVKDMTAAFEGCSALLAAPEIEDGVETMTSAFADCSSMTSGPSTIPSSVTLLMNTFRGCSSLTGTMTINTDTYNYGNMFNGTTQPIVLNGSSVNLSSIAGTSTNGNVTVDGALLSGTALLLPSYRLTWEQLKTSGSAYGYDQTALSDTEIGYRAFWSCSRLSDIYILNGVTSIGDEAFKDCSNMTEMYIPSSVTSIGNNVFTGCTSLGTITYDGDMASFNAISKGATWRGGTNTFTVKCSDGTFYYQQ